MKEEQIKKDEEKTYEWVEVFVVPHYLIQEITDVGMEETYDKDRKRIDADDLRVAIVLSAGVPIVLAFDQRICIQGNGDLSIQALRSFTADGD